MGLGFRVGDHKQSKKRAIAPLGLLNRYIRDRKFDRCSPKTPHYLRKVRGPDLGLLVLGAAQSQQDGSK